MDSEPRSSAPPLPARVRGSVHYLAALLVVAVGAAAFAAAFRWLLSAVFHAVAGASDVVTMFQVLPPWARAVLPPIGGMIAGLLGLALARKEGGGVGDVMEAVVLGQVRVSMAATLLKSLGSWFAIAFGGSIGREGPLIQFGGALGGTVGRTFKLDAASGRALMAAGTAAGFAAAYNTPFAAVLFVLEVVTGIVAMDAVLSAVIAAAVATAITRALIGGGPIYGQRAFALVSATELLAYATLGVVAALGAQIFMRMLSGAESWFAKSGLKQPWRAAAGGLVVGAIAIGLPQVTGNGYEPLNAMLDGAIPLALLACLLAAKAIATTASVSSGSPGGVFTPTLFIGAAIGVCFQHALVACFGVNEIAGAGAYALVGMAATTAATTHAPIMAALLVFELSGDYAIVLPVLLATGMAAACSRVLRADSIYSAELHKRGIRWELTLEGRRVLR